MRHRSLVLLSAGLAGVVAAALFFTRPLGEGEALTPVESKYEASPTWSPDGSEILFTRFKEPMILDLKTLRIVSAVSRPMTIDCADPHLSPDGGQFIFTSQALGWQLLLVGKGGDPSSARMLSDGKVPHNHPRFSPDGRYILCARGKLGHQKLFLLSTDGSPAPSFPDLPGSHRHPDWSRDGKLIVFSIDRHICVVNADGQDLRQITEGDGAWDDEPSLSPDSSMIVFASRSRGTGPRDLFIVPTAGGQPVQWTHQAGRCYSPEWSPDGRRIVFVRINGAECFLNSLPAPASVSELHKKASPAAK